MKRRNDKKLMMREGDRERGEEVRKWKRKKKKKEKERKIKEVKKEMF